MHHPVVCSAALELVAFRGRIPGHYFLLPSLAKSLANEPVQIQPANVEVISIADKVANGEVWVLGGSLA